MFVNIIGKTYSLNPQIVQGITDFRIRKGKYTALGF